MEIFMEKAKVLIIDSGVYTNHPSLKENHILGFTYRDGELDETIDDEYGHGTAIYGILHECAQNADITSIRLQNIENGADENELIGLLEYVDLHMNFDIINMSMGINKYTNESLRHVCNRLYQKGTIIISAFSNAGCFSYPASFPFVIGVTTDNQCKNINEWVYHEDEVVQIGAFGGIQRLKWREPSFVLKSGNSFACAHITKQVIDCYSKGIIKYEDILTYLKDHAKQTIKDSYANYLMPQKLPNISRAALFPVSKEMHAFFRFSESLPFEIAGVFDHKYSVNIKKSTNRIIQTDKAIDYIIQDIANIEWKQCDAIIIGHIRELLSYKQIHKIVVDVLRDAIEHDKIIYSFDNLTHLLPQNNYPHYYFPSVNDGNVPPIRYGKMHEISTPVVGIFGTSSRQGKFTLQLYLRKLFIEMGYRVGQLGTEPHSLLFGMDAVYPMGYDTTVKLNHIDQIRYLNHVIHTIDQQNKDIILVGSQSGSVNYAYCNINYYPIAQYCFLTGTLPDCVVLCVNPYDDISYIKRTINFIESVACTKVLALVIFPKTISEKWLAISGAKFPLSEKEFRGLQQRYCEELSLPAVRLDDIDGIRKISEMVVDFFCEGGETVI